MATKVYTRWDDMPQALKADGITIKWIGCDDEVWDIGGWNEGAQGAVISGPVTGLIHVPFSAVRHSPAYQAPRFERTVDELKEISFPITLMADNEFGWFDTEDRWWNGCNRDRHGWLCVFTRRTGELFIPAQLSERVEDVLEVDPTGPNGDYSHEWLIKLAVPDGVPEFRNFDLRPEPWVAKNADPILSVKRDENLLSPNIDVRTGKLRVANRGTKPTFPIYCVEAPGRVWLPDGLSGRMIRVPRLFDGEHVIIDTDPEHRIAISASDPRSSWLDNILSNIDLLEWLGITEFQDRTETILERFHGQGFSQPIPAGTVATLPVWHSRVGGRVSVHLPQRYERPI